MSTWINLEAPQGNDATWMLQVTNFGVPLNLTGYTLKLYVKATNTANDSTATIYTISGGLTMVSTVGGTLNFTLPHTSTYSQTPGQYWWRLDLIDGSGNVTTAMDGNLYVLAV